MGWDRWTAGDNGAAVGCSTARGIAARVAAPAAAAVEGLVLQPAACAGHAAVHIAAAWGQRHTAAAANGTNACSVVGTSPAGACVVPHYKVAWLLGASTLPWRAVEGSTVAGSAASAVTPSGETGYFASVTFLSIQAIGPLCPNYLSLQSAGANSAHSSPSASVIHGHRTKPGRLSPCRSGSILYPRPSSMCSPPNA